MSWESEAAKQATDATVAKELLARAIETAAKVLGTATTTAESLVKTAQVTAAERIDASQPLPPTSTHEEDLHSAGQRRVNLIWEYTQAAIAVVVVAANVAAAFVLLDSANAMLTNAFFLIVGFYFGRTNHARVGGVQLGR